MNAAPAPGGPKVVVLVTGASGCGKTSLARSMTARLPGLAVIHQDSYFIQPFLDYDARVDDSSESPRSLGWAKLRADVGVAAAASGVAGVLVEGHMLPTDTELVAMASVCVLLRAPQEVCRGRRVGRRSRPRPEQEQLERYYDNWVWPAHVQYWEPAAEQLQARCRETGATVVDIDTADGRDMMCYVEQAVTAVKEAATADAARTSL